MVVPDARPPIVCCITRSRVHCTHADTETDGCDQWATSGTDRNTPQRCEKHSTPTDVCLVERVCSGCGLLNCANVCVTLCARDDLYQALRKLHRVKEATVGKCLMTRISMPLTSANQTMNSRCGGFRNDFGFDCGPHVVIPEVDERQHSGYD